MISSPLRTSIRTSFSVSTRPGVASEHHLARGFQSTATRAIMQIIPLRARSDNWMYLIVDPTTSEAAVVDPYDHSKMLELVKEKGVKVTTLLTTHHHDDHSGGNKQFLANLPTTSSSIKAYAGSHSPGTNTVIKDGSTFRIGENIKVRCLHTPCHTQDSICFYLEDGEGKKGVFTGDTLFQGGCGRFFEGTPEEMHKALTYLGTLPADTVVYNGHEYTPGSAKFGASVEPGNEDIKMLVELSKSTDCTTGQTTIADEKKWNVFMRLDSPAVQKATNETEPVKVMKALREMKNKF